LQYWDPCPQPLTSNLNLNPNPNPNPNPKINRGISDSRLFRHIPHDLVFVKRKLYIQISKYYFFSSKFHLLEPDLMKQRKRREIFGFSKIGWFLRPPGSSFVDIPIVTEYKYLGLVVDQKLISTKQLAFIEEKTNHQCAALWPLLKAFSLTERINLWTILCRPSFEMLIFPYYAERSTTNTNKVHSKSEERSRNSAY